MPLPAQGQHLFGNGSINPGNIQGLMSLVPGLGGVLGSLGTDLSFGLPSGAMPPSPAALQQQQQQQQQQAMHVQQQQQQAMHVQQQQQQQSPLGQALHGGAGPGTEMGQDGGGGMGQQGLALGGPMDLSLKFSMSLELDGPGTGPVDIADGRPQDGDAR
jgi:hypothetical protein